MITKRNTSGFKGVHWDQRRNKWRAVIGLEYSNKHLGYFVSRRDAIICYNKAARRFHGPDAYQNPVPDDNT